MKRALFAALIVVFLIVPAYSAQKLTYVDLVNRLTDLEGLSVLPAPGEKCVQWSSWHRVSVYDETNKKYLNWEANGDGNGIIRTEGDQQVFAEMEGPGCIWRIWSAAPKEGHVRIYLDGSTEPVVDMPFSDYFNLKNAPFVYPALVHDASAGKNSYVPIPFQKSCKITADKDWGAYYQFTYTIFPKGTQVPTFKRDLAPEETAALVRANRFLTTQLGTDPAGLRDRQTALVPKVSVAPGTTATVARLTGPGAITRLGVRMDTSKVSPDMLRHVILKIRWDGEKEPSVWCPIGDFFGTAPGANRYRSLPLGVTEDGFYSFWYMPFAKSAVVELTNVGDTAFAAPIEIVRAPLTKPIKNLARFHAKWHRDAFLPTEPERWIDWPMLKTQGKGRFVGVSLEVWNPRGGWWGEGDEKFFVDGEKFPSTFGTGSEDYFGYAWCNPALFQNAYHNQTRNDGNNVGHVAVNRWQISDNIPFHTAFEGDIEKYYKNERPTLYSCVPYWYQAPGGKDLYKSVAEKDLIFYIQPEKFKVQGVLEGESLAPVQKSAGTTEKQILFAANSKWSDEAQLLWKGGKVGDKLVLAIPVEKAGSYQLKAQLTKNRDGGIVQLYFDDKKVGDPIDLFERPAVATGELSFGTHDVTAGRHTLTIEIIGKNEKSTNTFAGLDYVKLAPSP